MIWEVLSAHAVIEHMALINTPNYYWFPNILNPAKSLSFWFSMCYERRKLANLNYNIHETFLVTSLKRLESEYWGSYSEAYAVNYFHFICYAKEGFINPGYWSLISYTLLHFPTIKKCQHLVAMSCARLWFTISYKEPSQPKCFVNSFEQKQASDYAHFHYSSKNEFPSKHRN